MKTESSYKLFTWHSTLSNIDGAAGDGEQKTEERSIKGSVWCGCASGVVGTLWEEGHPVNETYTTKNTDSQWSSDGHFTKSCESHTPAGHTILSPLSLSATCTVYRTISRASGLFNVVIQAEHNCVPPSDRRLRTSSLLTKKPATLRWGQAHLREEIFLCPPPPSLSLFLFLLAGWKERFKG